MVEKHLSYICVHSNRRLPGFLDSPEYIESQLKTFRTDGDSFDLTSETHFETKLCIHGGR